MADNENEVNEGWREQVRVLKEQVAQANIDAGEAHQAAEGARILAAGLEEQMQALTKERDAARVECGLAHSAREVTVNERDAAKADAARLREALNKIARPKRGGIEANDSDEDWFEYLRNALERERATARVALAAASSTEWLAKHDEEVARRVRDEVVRLFRVAYDGPCVRGEKIVASRTVDQLLRGAE